MQYTTEQIKAFYPEPVSGMSNTSNNADAYCVGGAFCRFFRNGQGNRFPFLEELAAVIRRVNPNIAEGDALVYAERIITANDDGCFDLSWSVVDMVLNHK